MNIGEIAERFIRAAEIERASHEHVGPAPLRAQQLPYVHDQADKNGWGKAREQRVVKKGKLIQGDWLDEHEDPLAAERKAFWERIGIMPTAREPSQHRPRKKRSRFGSNFGHSGSQRIAA